MAVRPEIRQSPADEEKLFWLVPSRHWESGIFHYAYYRLDFKNEVTTPAGHQVDLIIVVNGGCLYEGMEVKKGDVFVHGMNKTPITSFSTDIELFVVGTCYEVLYRKFGIMPFDYHARAMKLLPDHRLGRYGYELSQTPKERWIEQTELFMEGILAHSEMGLPSASFECALWMAKSMEQDGNGDEEACCREFGISKRHLQRQFVRFFGFTMRDYERMLRFSKAFWELGDRPLAETALSAGYYDQAHMNREFRQMAGLSPQSAAKQSIYASLKETIKWRKQRGPSDS